MQTQIEEKNIVIESIGQEMKRMQEVLEEKEYHVEMLQKDEVEYRE